MVTTYIPKALNPQRFFTKITRLLIKIQRAMGNVDIQRESHKTRICSQKNEIPKPSMLQTL